MKKRTLKRVLWQLLFLISLSIVFPLVAYGESAVLSVKAILPENQFDKSVSYYSLMMKPGDKQEIELQLFNSSTVETTALVTLTNGTTNNGGLIDYTLADKEIDDSLLYPFTEIASTPEEVIIPPESNVIAKIKLEMPAEEYDGMILGGVNVKAKKNDEKKEEDEKTGGMKIENEINYAIGVLLIENEQKVKTDMKLKRVFASQVMGENTTEVTLQNPTTAVMEDVQIEAKVYRKGSDDILYEVKREDYRMAPNSSFDFGIPLGNQAYQGGTYRVKLVATSNPKNPVDGERQTWEFDEEFYLTRKEAKELNEKANIPEADYLLYIIIGVSLLVFLLVLSVGVSIKNQQAKKKRKARNRKNIKRK